MNLGKCFSPGNLIFETLAHQVDRTLYLVWVNGPEGISACCLVTAGMYSSSASD